MQVLRKFIYLYGVRFSRLFDIGEKNQLAIFLHRRSDEDAPDVLRIVTCSNNGAMFSFDIPFFEMDQASTVMEALDGENALFFFQFIGRQLGTIIHEDVVFYLDDHNDIAYVAMFCDAVGIDYIDIPDDDLGASEMVMAAKIIRDIDGPYVELRELPRPPGDTEEFRINKNSTEERFKLSHAARRVSSMAFPSLCIEIQKINYVLNQQRDEAETEEDAY